MTFGSYKDRGFDLERPGVTAPKRLERPFGLVTLAWLNCLKVGVWREGQVSIRILAHGLEAMSLVRYGAEFLRNVWRWDLKEKAEMIGVIVSPFLAPGAA